MTEEHDPTQCLDPACMPCLDQERRESVVRLEVELLNAEIEHPDGAWIDGTVTVDALDVRNLLDLVRGA